MIDEQKIYVDLKNAMRRISTTNWVGAKGQPIDLDSDPRFLMHTAVPQNILMLTSYDSLNFLKIAESNSHAQHNSAALLVNEIINAKYGPFKNRWVHPDNKEQEEMSTDHWSLEGEKIHREYSSIKIPGRSFIAYPYDKAYWHMMLEDIAFYFQLKEIFKDMKFVICKDENFKNVMTNRTWMKEYYDLVIEKYGKDVVEVDLQKINSISLEKSYSMNSFDVDSTLKTFLNPFLLLQKFFDVGNDVEKTEKIFLYAKGKKDYMKSWLIENQDVVNKYVMDGIVDKNGKILKPYANYDTQEAKTAYQIADVFSRLLEEEDEMNFVHYAISKGYTILDPSDYGAKEQKDIFKKCKKLMIMNGAMTLSATMCSPGADVIIINSNTNYEFPHGRYVKSLTNLNVYEVFDPIEKPNTKFTIKDVVMELEKLDIL